MSDRRVQILRFWLVAIAACVLAVWHPWFASGLEWLPLCLSIPTFGPLVDPCSHCSTDTTTKEIQCDITGFVNGATLCGDCMAYNVSTILTQDNPGGWTSGLCFYGKTLFNLTPVNSCPCGFGGTNPCIVIGFTRESGTNKLRLDVIDNSTDSIFIMTGGGNGQDCEDTETISSLSFSSGVCDFSVVSVTLTPIVA